MPANTIVLVPVGNLDIKIINRLNRDLSEIFQAKVITKPKIEIPSWTYVPERRQYNSSLILNIIYTNRHNRDYMLAIIDHDLFAADLNFVFGEANIPYRTAIISLTRLRQSYYALPDNTNLFFERTLKEAVHELGHLYGLSHCPNLSCVMHFSNSLSDTDRKRHCFCQDCQKQINF